MFIDRRLRIALLASFSWHLFLMSFFSVVFLPVSFDTKDYPPVNFLGSILNGPFLVGQAPPGQKRQFIEMPAGVDIADKAPFNEMPDASFTPGEENIDPDSYVDIDRPAEETAALSSRAFFKPADADRERRLIKKPSPPGYPEWSQQEFRTDSITMRIYISAEGLVEGAVNLQSSGSVEIDTALARYVSRWRFEPVSGEQGTWQTVKIRLDFEGERKAE